MKRVKEYQIKLVNAFQYKKLPTELSIKARDIYLNHLPEQFNMNGSQNAHLFSRTGIPIATGYERIVIGDYGAFVEMSREQVFFDNFIIQPGQEYRQSNKYKDNIKYDWYTTREEDIKIYFQKKKVAYADYIPGKFYVCPYELF